MSGGNGIYCCHGNNMSSVGVVITVQLCNRAKFVNHKTLKQGSSKCFHTLGLDYAAHKASIEYEEDEENNWCKITLA